MIPLNGSIRMGLISFKFVCHHTCLINNTIDKKIIYKSYKYDFCLIVVKENKIFFLLLLELNNIQ